MLLKFAADFTLSHYRPVFEFYKHYRKESCLVAWKIHSLSCTVWSCLGRWSLSGTQTKNLVRYRISLSWKYGFLSFYELCSSFHEIYVLCSSYSLSWSIASMMLMARETCDLTKWKWFGNHRRQNPSKTGLWSWGWHKQFPKLQLQRTQSILTSLWLSENWFPLCDVSHRYSL